MTVAITFLAVKTLILSVAALFVLILFQFVPVRSPGLHRLVWGGVLLLGLFGGGFPVTIPVSSPAEKVEATSSMIGMSDIAEMSQTVPATENFSVPFREDNFTESETAILSPLTETAPREAEPHLVASNAPHVAPAMPSPISPERTQAVKRHAIAALTAIWFAGIVFLLIRRFILRRVLARRLQNSTPVQGRDLDLWQTLLRERRISPKKLALLTTPEIGPALVRTRRGMAIVVPADLWDEANERVKSGILRHELTHYAQHDLFVCGFMRLLVALHWFNPLAWLAVAKFEEAAEWTCDVAAFGRHRNGELHFAESMLALHEATPSITLCRSAFGGGRLTRRARLLRTTILQPKESVMKKILVLAVVVPLLLAGAIQLRFAVRANVTAPSRETQNAPGEFWAEVSHALIETFDPAVTNSDNPTMTLLVLDPDGNPIPGATGLTHRFDRDQQRIFKRFTTDEHGLATFELPKKSNVGTFTFTVQTPGYTPFHARWEFENRIADLPASCRVKLEKAKTVSGIVKNENGEPVGGVKVEFSFPLERHTNGDTQLGCSCSATTDAEGRWTYASLPEDVTAPRGGLSLTHPDYMPSRTNDGVFSETAIIRKGLEFGGIVKDESGNPVTGATVEVEFVDVNGTHEEKYRKTVADDEGRFVFKNCPTSQEAIVVASAPGFSAGWKKTEFVPNAKSLELTIPSSKSIRLQIVDTAGKPITNAYAWVGAWGPFQSYGPILSGMLRNENNRGALRIIPVDEKGYWTWEDAPSGPMTITIEAPGHMGQKNVAVEAGQEPKTVTLAFSLQVTGTVVDDATGEPIPAFRVTEGFFVNMHRVPNLPHVVSWQTNRTSPEKDGEFVHRFETAETDRHLRVEADGYEPCDSRAVDNGEGDVKLEFRMKRLSAEILARKEKAVQARSGRLLTPDGEPAAYATVVYATNSPSDGIGLSMHDLGGFAHRSVKSDKEGRFTLPPIELDETRNERFAFVAIHGSGFVRVEQEEFEKNHETATDPDAQVITLEPWGEIEGTLLFGSKPGKNMTISLDSRDPLRFEHEKRPRIDYHYTTETDANGRFAFRQVAPGDYELVRRRYVSTGGGSSAGFPLNSMLLSVGSGEKKSITFGGTGRPVVGKLSTAPGLEEWPTNSWQLASVRPELPPEIQPPEFPADVQAELEKIQEEAEQLRGDMEQWNALHERWFQTETGRQAEAVMKEWREKNASLIQQHNEIISRQTASPQVVLQAIIEKDGTFRVENVPAGNWTLSVSILNENFEDIGNVEPRNFTIPEMPGGRSDEPFDLGGIDVR